MCTSPSGKNCAEKSKVVVIVGLFKAVAVTVSISPWKTALLETVTDGVGISLTVSEEAGVCDEEGLDEEGSDEVLFCAAQPTKSAKTISKTAIFFINSPRKNYSKKSNKNQLILCVFSCIIYFKR